MAGWAVFFVAEVGASAALAGFVIVAISINLARIISYPWLPGRVAETLVAPTGVLVVSSYMLVPGQQLAALATELFVTGGVMWLMSTVIQIRTWGAEAAVPRRSLVVRCTLSLLSRCADSDRRRVDVERRSQCRRLDGSGYCRFVGRDRDQRLGFVGRNRALVREQCVS